MKSFLIIILFLFCISCEKIGKGYAWQGEEAPGFTRKYGTKGYDYGWNAAASKFDGGIILVGRQQRKINGQIDLWAIKTNTRGLIEWEKTFGGEKNEEGYDVISTSDGGFLFVGFSWSFGNKQQVYVIKTDIMGITLWEKTFGGSMWDVGEAVIELKEGGFLIAGHSNSPFISSGNSDIYLIKINNEGNIIWEKAYGNTEFPNHEWAYDLTQIPDGGFLVVGARDRYDEGSKNALIIRIDNSGDLVWEKELVTSGNINEVIYTINDNNDGKYFICSTENSLSNPTLYHPRILKIDIEGNISWDRALLANGKEYHRFQSTETKNGNVVIIGTSGREVSRGYDEDAFMVRLDGNGNILWSTSFGTYDNDDWGWSLFETETNDLVFIGSTKSYGASLFDIFLFGTNSEGISK